MVAKESAKSASREEAKKADKDKNKGQKSRRIRIRLIPIWARLLIVVVLMILSTLAGIVIGYGVVGSGNPADALDRSTWQHIIDLVEKE